MKKITAQWDGKVFHPYTDQDRDEAAGLKSNQIVSLKVAGVQKVPSVRQLNLFWSACELFAENSTMKDFDTKDKVADQLKVELDFIDLNKSFVDPKGNFHPHYMSISFDNLRQIDRSKFIERALEQMAKWLGIDIDSLVRETKLRIQRW